MRLTMQTLSWVFAMMTIMAAHNDVGAFSPVPTTTRRVTPYTGAVAAPAFVRPDAFRKTVSYVKPNDDEDYLLEAEEMAVIDGHDCSDPGMETAAEERAVMLAQELLDQELQSQKTSNSWQEEHLAHGIEDVHLDTNEELLEAEEMAAMDGHDSSDPGMETAAEERAVMLAQEMVKKLKNKPKKDSSWQEEHLAHGIKDVHLDTNEELLEAEEMAAMDGHDSSDPGMETAAEERAVMLAQEMVKKLKNKPKKDDSWQEEHLAHGIEDVHLDTNEELLEAEEMAAMDGHDSSDPGMETAAEERAVMLAQEMVKKLKNKPKKDASWQEEHLAHGIEDVHLDTNEELLEAEEMAAMDGHDSSDPGMETAAEERSVMLAQELIKKLKVKVKTALSSHEQESM